MMHKKHAIQAMLDSKPHLRPYLFRYGFVLTDGPLAASGYPFYDAWTPVSLPGLRGLIHPDQTFYRADCGSTTCFLIGHAYDPFDMEHREAVLLERLARAAEPERRQLIDQLTGVFTLGLIDGGRLRLYCDCAGMQSCCYGTIGGSLYITSHMQLVGDLCALEQSDYVRRLTAYRFYRYYGAFLPGDLSSYAELKRLVPNTHVTFRDGDWILERFYPHTPIGHTKADAEYRETIRRIAGILNRTMDLIAQKWQAPAISMTGGMDSKATLAAAHGLYDRFRYFSYVSMPGEQPDADAAHKIAAALGIDHRVDRIPDRDAAFDDLQEIASLLCHNFGNIGPVNANDVRKRAYYAQAENRHFDVEVKSWVSEIGRANYYKKFGLRRMPRHLSPRHMTSMYKLFLHDRTLVRQTDEIFADYIRRTDFRRDMGLDESDLFLWEIRYGSWGGQVITCEHKFSFDITVPYNNRLLMELFLTLPLERRISDQVHYDLIRELEPVIDATGITITNHNETKARMYKEKLYFLIHSILPF